mgnify:CR=1 FL=1
MIHLDIVAQSFFISVDLIVDEKFIEQILFCFFPKIHFVQGVTKEQLHQFLAWGWSSPKFFSDRMHISSVIVFIYHIFDSMKRRINNLTFYKDIYFCSKLAKTSLL